MPPGMGAGAFIMADMLGVPYLDVCKAAIIPGALYFFALFWMVHMEALKSGLRGLNRDELPQFWPVVKGGGHLMIPAFLLVAFLIMCYSPMKSGLWAIIAVWIVSFLKKSTRMNLTSVLNAMEKGARGCLEVALACACAGIVIGCVTQTGLGLKFSSLVVAAAGGKMIFTLIFVMVASLILGIELTTSAAYILTVILGGPVLVELGIPPLAAHMFVFYYAYLSCITPPVALGSGMMGYLRDRLNWGFRILLLMAGLGLIKPELVTDLFGIFALGGILLYQYWENRHSAAAMTSGTPG